jgi:hypothetical protein
LEPDVDAPREPKDLPARRGSARRTAWVLGAIAAGLYVYAMYKVMTQGAMA